MGLIRLPVEQGAILMFARAIGDPNPVYFDAEYAASSEVGGIIAPPTFVQTSAQFDPDYPLRPRLGEPWLGSGATPSGALNQPGSGLGGGLHAEQEFVYHRVLRPGDVLSAEPRPGGQWQKQGRSGKLSFSETFTDFRDQYGEIVVTSRSVVVGLDGTDAPDRR